jgi:16S rRNA (guanine966-N2)-methyltransferase
MRIIAGKFKGRILADPTSRVTHPMSEKIRGALFNTLGDVDGLTLFDAFTGTGSVAIEGMSRGISSTMAIDNDVDAFKCVTENVHKLALSPLITIVCGNVTTWCKNNPSKLFDIVVADPPFDVVNDDLLARLALKTKKGGIFVASLPDDFNPKAINGLDLLKTKTYGNAKLHFYRNTI